MPSVNSVPTGPRRDIIEQFLGLVRVFTRELEHRPIDPADLPDWRERIRTLRVCPLQLSSVGFLSF